MSVASELTQYNDLLKNAYDAATAKGATIAEQKNLENLSSAITSIKTGGGGSGSSPYDYGITYLQDFATCSLEDYNAAIDSMVELKHYSFIDKRDNEVYDVAKMADGSVWFCENLRLWIDKSPGSVGASLSLSPDDSDVIEDFDKNVLSYPTSQHNRFDDAERRYLYYAYYANYIHLNVKNGLYYNWACVTANSGIDGGSENVITPTSSISPKGWTLPTKEEADSLISVYKTGEKASETDNVEFNKSFRPVVLGMTSKSQTDEKPTSFGIYGYFWLKSIVGSGNKIKVLYSGQANGVLTDYSLGGTSTTGPGSGANVRCILRKREV